MGQTKSKSQDVSQYEIESLKIALQEKKVREHDILRAAVANKVSPCIIAQLLPMYSNHVTLTKEQYEKLMSLALQQPETSSQQPPVKQAGGKGKKKAASASAGKKKKVTKTFKLTGCKTI